jgi:hypothetical protein
MFPFPNFAYVESGYSRFWEVDGFVNIPHYIEFVYIYSANIMKSFYFFLGIPAPPPHDPTLLPSGLFRGALRSRTRFARTAFGALHIPNAKQAQGSGRKAKGFQLSGLLYCWIKVDCKKWNADDADFQSRI